MIYSRIGCPWRHGSWTCRGDSRMMSQDDMALMMWIQAPKDVGAGFTASMHTPQQYYSRTSLNRPSLNRELRSPPRILFVPISRNAFSVFLCDTVVSYMHPLTNYAVGDSGSCSLGAVYGLFNNLVKPPTSPTANIFACPQDGGLTMFDCISNNILAHRPLQQFPYNQQEILDLCSPSMGHMYVHTSRIHSWPLYISEVQCGHEWGTLDNWHLATHSSNLWNSAIDKQCFGNLAAGCFKNVLEMLMV